MPFITATPDEIKRRMLKLTRTHEMYYKAETDAEKQRLWLNIQIQKAYINELENVTEWARA